MDDLVVYGSSGNARQVKPRRKKQRSQRNHVNRIMAFTTMILGYITYVFDYLLHAICLIGNSWD